MAKVYYILLKDERNTKINTIEDVPMRIRAEVQALIDAENDGTNSIL